MLSSDKITSIFCLIDDMLKGIDHKEHAQRKMSDSEVITTAFVSALYFGGHMDHARNFMKTASVVLILMRITGWRAS